MNTPKKKKRFTREQLRDAIFAVHDGASKRDAAKEFGIPLTTLIRRLRNPFPSPIGNPVEQGPLTSCVRLSFPIAFLATDVCPPQTNLSRCNYRAKLTVI